MKSRKLYTKLLLAGSLVLMSGAMTSCDDFLTLLPTDQLPEENFWQDKADLEGVRAGAYQQLSQSGCTSKILTWGELRADNLTLNNMNQTDISYIQDGILQPNKNMFDWANFYTGINYCNLVLEEGYRMTEPDNEVDPSFTRNDYKMIRAEMLALRSLYYFYLVRAYREVPYVTQSVRTDKVASSNKPAADPGVAILGECIDSLEANVQYGADNFGSESMNRGQFTKTGIHALLADMYLWRAALLKDYMSKDYSGYFKGKVNMSDKLAEVESGSEGESTEGEEAETPQVYVTKDGETINNAYCNKLSQECVRKAIEHATWCIDKLKKDYDKEIDENPNMYTQEELTQPYPLIRNQRSGYSVMDQSYYSIFGSQNSTEGILELQYDGTSTTNSVVGTYLSSYSNNAFNAQYMVISSGLIQSTTSVNPTIGFGKTDFRLAESCNTFTRDAGKPITKFVARMIIIDDISDITKTTDNGNNVSYSERTQQDAHWQIYRLSDVMMIKAEALARLDSPSEDELKEGFQLVNEIFKRNNPYLINTTEQMDGVEDEYRCDRLDENYAEGKSKAELLSLTYRERQREFFAEGKRWFDLVRQSEFTNNPKETMSTYGSFKNTVVNRLTKIYSLYNPYYSEELKVNGLEYGGKLIQNPVWERYTKN